jgi:cytochrome c6
MSKHIAGKRGRLVATVVGVLVAVLGFAGAGFADADGGKVYKDKCIGCHGADGSGDTPVGKAQKAGDLRSAPIQGQSDAQLALTVSKGKGKMQPFGKKLTQDEITAVVKYLRTLKKT